MSTESIRLTACTPCMEVATSPVSVDDYLCNGHNLDNYEQGLRQALNTLRRRLADTRQPFTGILPAELAPLFKQVDLGQPCADLATAMQELDALYLQDAVYFHHPRYLAHLNCPVVIPAVLAELIQATVNSSLDTWDQSIGGTLIEQKLIDWTTGLLALGEAADGIFTSGGTQSNLMAMLLARDNFCAERWNHSTRKQGLHSEAHRLRIFTSCVSHFSVQKAAAMLGLGYDSVIPVATDRYFRMDPQALEASLEAARGRNLIPMAVVATAGTTDYGSIDPLPALADIARTHKLWFHVDAAYGCGLLVSPRHRQRLAGIEQADSVTVDYHKSFLQPVSCSACLVRERRTLSCVTWHADYLNPLSQQAEGIPNLVDKSLQTTRRFDALKLWLTLRTIGAPGLGEAFDRVLHLARQAYMLLLSDDIIEVVHQPQLSTLVFRFRPHHDYPDTTLNDINLIIRKKLMRSGQALIAGTRLEGRCYLKLTLLNPATTIHDIRAVLQQIKRYGDGCLATLDTTETGTELEFAEVSNG